jgi:DNA-directed RNA polymerase specialized sigma24 family protein
MNNIEARLINWSRWCRRPHHRAPADCITGFVCERMRKAALGNVWSGHEVTEPLDERDAVRLERCMRKLHPYDRTLLKLHYVQRVRWQIVCRRVRVRVDEVLFAQRLASAENAIKQLVDSQQTGAHNSN